MLKMTDINLKKKSVLIRMDLNVPIHNGKITSYTRIDSSIPTIKIAIKQNSKIIIASHLGRPIPGKFDEKYSLFPIFEYLKKKIKNTKIFFSKNYLNNGININYGEIVVLENVRFNIGEKNNDDSLSKKYSKLCDVFVMDAFASAHRIESSTYGICDFVKQSCAGPLLISEINILSQIMKNPKRPMIAIVGGSKVSTKFNLLNSLLKITDYILVGGGIANTFISLKNSVGKSLYEKKFKENAEKLYKSNKIIIPIDSRIEDKKNKFKKIKTKLISEILENEKIMDIGNNSIKKYSDIINKAKTILWNGPLGVFERKEFSYGTFAIAKKISESSAFSVAGGGDTLSVIDILNIKNKISYISTGGGAFLKFIEKNTFPILKKL